MVILDVQGLTVEYQTEAGIFRAVENLSFRLEQGKTLGLVGESGCGKTTAMLALMRLLPEEGRIIQGRALLEGLDMFAVPVTRMREIRWRKISLIFQGAMNALNPVKSVGSQIEEVLRLHKTVPGDQASKEVGKLLEYVGIPASRANQYPFEYSGGMRQRAMIAMALACRPQVVIADEPTTALDVMVQAQILDLLQNLQAELNLSIILVTHDLGLVAEICDDVLVMYGGKMAEYASSDIIFNDSRHPYTQRLMNAFPDVEHPRSTLASIPGSPPTLDDLPPGCRFQPRCHLAIEACSALPPPELEVSPGHYASCIRVEELSQISGQA
jgi:peptide/nickel transport system ATP-binding protein